MLPVILAGIGAATAWGLVDVCIAKSTQTIRPVLAAGLVNSLGAVLFTVYYFVFVEPPPSLTVGGIWLSVAAGIFVAIASMIFFVALKKGPIGIVSAISSTYPAVTLLLVMGVFGATVSRQQLLGIVMVIVGVAIASGLASKTKFRAQSLGPFIAIGAAISWGVGYGLLAQGVEQLGWQTATLVQALATMACFLLLGVVGLKRGKLTGGSFRTALSNPFIAGAAVLQQVGATLLPIGLSIDKTGGSVVVALSACYPILVMVLAYTFFAERAGRVALAGGLVGIGGIVVLSAS